MRTFLKYKQVDTHKQAVGSEAHKKIDVHEQNSVHSQYAKQRDIVLHKIHIDILKKQFIYINTSDLHRIKKKKIAM
jgi:hypothetical protein